MLGKALVSANQPWQHVKPLLTLGKGHWASCRGTPPPGAFVCCAGQAGQRRSPDHLKGTGAGLSSFRRLGTR